MLTGTPPYADLSHGAVIRAIMTRQPPPFVTAPARLSKLLVFDSLWCIAFHCRREDPELRPQAADLRIAVPSELYVAADAILGPSLTESEEKGLQDELQAMKRGQQEYQPLSAINVRMCYGVSPTSRGPISQAFHSSGASVVAVHDGPTWHDSDREPTLRYHLPDQEKDKRVPLRHKGLVNLWVEEQERRKGAAGTENVGEKGGRTGAKRIR